jgi:predicted adenine nucleotide alpha hydrolase (AANH) superfamily ATPase
VKDLIIIDTREKGHKKILEYFDQVQQDYIISKLDAGDYMIYKDYSTIIDKKDGLLELCGNLCKATEHQRLVREVEKAHELGCKDFIFLIQDSKIKSKEDIFKWWSPYTKVKGKTLYAIMQTFKEHHDCRFVIVPREDMGKMIIDLLTKK